MGKDDSGRSRDRKRDRSRSRDCAEDSGQGERRKRKAAKASEESESEEDNGKDDRRRRKAAKATDEPEVEEEARKDVKKSSGKESRKASGDGKGAKKEATVAKKEKAKKEAQKASKSNGKDEAAKEKLPKEVQKEGQKEGKKIKTKAKGATKKAVKKKVAAGEVDKAAEKTGAQHEASEKEKAERREALPKARRKDESRKEKEEKREATAKDNSHKDKKDGKIIRDTSPKVEKRKEDSHKEKDSHKAKEDRKERRDSSSKEEKRRDDSHREKDDRSRREPDLSSLAEIEAPEPARKRGEERVEPRQEVQADGELRSGSPSRARSGGSSCSRRSDSGSRDRRRHGDNGGVRDAAASGFGAGSAASAASPAAYGPPLHEMMALDVEAPLPEKVQALLGNPNTLFQDVLKMRKSLEDAHGVPAPLAAKLKPKEEVKETVLKIPPRLHEALLHPSNESRLLARTGLSHAALNEEGLVVLRASSANGLNKALSQLRRIAYHCQWGCNRAKVAALLTEAKPTATMLVRLAATSSRLRSHEARLTQKAPKLRLGTQAGPGSLVIDGIPGLSRRHCTITFEPEKGVCYLQDLSTNGTYLNGKRLPRPPYKNPQDARVRLFHGDELFFRLRSEETEELGYVCNIVELS